MIRLPSFACWVAAALLAAGCRAPAADARGRGLFGAERPCARFFASPPSGDDAIDRDESASYAQSPPAAADGDFRAHAPASGSERAFVLPRIDESRLTNGIRVLFVERHDLPIVSMRVGIDRGAADAAPGVAAFFAETVDGGTDCRSGSEVSAIARTLGASLSTYAEHDSTVVSLNVLTPGVGPGIELVSDLVLSTSLEVARIDRLIPSALASLAQRHERPALVLEDTIAEAIYPADHAYATSPRGQARAIEQMSRRDLVTFRDAYLRPDRVTIAVAGDVGRAELLATLEYRFGAWRAATANAPARRDIQAPPAAAPRTIVVDDRGATQSIIALSCAGVPRSTPDYAAVRVLERALSWALDRNLRQKHGYTYGMRARFAMRRGAGPFTAGGAVAREHTVDAVRELFAEVEKIRAAPLSPSILRDVQRQLISANGAMFETADETTEALLRLATYGLPLDEHATLPARLRAVTADDVRRAAERYLDPKRMHLVIVGDLATFREGLAGLGRGKAEIRSLRRKRGSGAEGEEREPR